MNSENIIVMPPFYSGTSFEEIFQSLKFAIKKYELHIDFIGNVTPSQNNSKGMFDDLQTIKEQYAILGKLLFKNKVRRLLFVDFFNPGLDLLMYQEQIKGFLTKKGALLHGGTFVPGDLYAWPWLEKSENLWFSAYDNIYVPSNFLSDLVPLQYKKKLEIFPWGLEHIDLPKRKKKADRIVVFPHRLSPDKGVDEFYEIACKLPDIQFLVTMPHLTEIVWYERFRSLPNVSIAEGENEQEHLTSLQRSKVVLSCAHQENFGYSLHKAVLCGCIPVLPVRAVYPEIFTSAHFYSSTSQAIEIIKKCIEEDGAVGEDMHKVTQQLHALSFLPLLKSFFKI